MIKEIKKEKMFKQQLKLLKCDEKPLITNSLGQQTQKGINSKRSIPTHIVVKTFKIKDREKHLKEKNDTSCTRKHE